MRDAYRRFKVWGIQKARALGVFLKKFHLPPDFWEAEDPLNERYCRTEDGLSPLVDERLNVKDKHD